MLEINTGVYVGDFNSRVRDELWWRICNIIQHGRAVMVYNTNNEQHYDFKTHNSDWVPKDYDGVSIIYRTSNDKRQEHSVDDKKLSTRSTAAKMLLAKRKQKSRRTMNFDNYIVLDVETTGINADKDEIIEIGALRITDNSVVAEFQSLVRIEGQLPKEIVKLTGITEAMLNNEGNSLERVLQELIYFVAEDKIVCYNTKFDRGFLETALKKHGHRLMPNSFIDILALARTRLKLDNYKLQTVAEHLSVVQQPSHRALEDCRATLEIFNKLMEV
jgi:CRISPR-associated protein Cas2